MNKETHNVDVPLTGLFLNRNTTPCTSTYAGNTGYNNKEDNLHTMPTLPLQCSNCNLTVTLQTKTTLGNYLLQHYGTIDKVQGKLFEIPCPLCIGVMEKQDES